MDKRRAERVAEGLFRMGGAAKRLVPERVRKHLDQRFFYAVFNLTRVTNDDLVSGEVRERRSRRAPD